VAPGAVKTCRRYLEFKDIGQTIWFALRNLVRDMDDQEIISLLLVQKRFNTEHTNGESSTALIERIANWLPGHFRLSTFSVG
jgi:hypothetical protein